jgi:nicotine blue oxidoreductase
VIWFPPGGVSLILLAAGGGSRFGGEPGDKLLADFGGVPLVEATLSGMSGSPVAETIVVAGARAGEVRESCEACEPSGARGLRVVENPEWKVGMSTSVRLGLAACEPGARAAVVALADQPLIGAAAVERLVESFEGGAEAAVATYGGEQRNPALFARGLWPMLVESLAGDAGARSVLRGRPDLVTEVPCDGVADPADVDTEEDLRRLESMMYSAAYRKDAGKAVRETGERSQA